MKTASKQKSRTQRPARSMRQKKTRSVSNFENHKYLQYFLQELHDFVQKQTLEGKSLVVSTPKFKTTIAKVFALLKSKT